MKLLQVTIGAGVTKFSLTDISARQVIVQNTGAVNSMRVGDKSTSTTVGIKLIAGASIIIGPFDVHAENLKNWYVAGTQNDLVDILYVG